MTKYYIIILLRIFLIIVAVFVQPQGFFYSLLLFAVWAMLMIGMLFRLIPNECVAIGARKHYISLNSLHPTGTDFELNHYTDKSKENKVTSNLHKGAMAIAVFWLTLNVVMFLLFQYLDMLTFNNAMILALTYSIFDSLFVIFFCPFQKFFMHNRCCTTCRIYNWDYIMICTPLLLFPSTFSVSLLATAFAVLLVWEIHIKKFPHRFMQETNELLKCKHCKVKPCRHQSNI